MFTGKSKEEQTREIEEKHEQTILAFNESKARLEEIDDKIADLEMEIASLSIKKSQLLIDIEELADKKSADKKSAEFSSIEDKITAKQNELKDLQQVIKDTISDKDLHLEKVNNEVEARRVETESLATKKQALEADLEKIEAEREKQVISARAEVKALVAEKDQLANEIRAKYTELDTITKQVALISARIEEDARVSLKKVADAEAQVSKLNEEITELKQESSILRDKAKTQKDELVSLEFEIEKAQKEKAECDAKITDSRKLMKHLINREEHIRGKYEELGLEYPEFK